MENVLGKICLGTAQFGSSYGLTNKSDELSIPQIHEILNLAKNNGINFIDTAPSYGDAEEKLGNLKLKDWNVVTKVKTGKNILINDSFSESVFESLTRLKIDKLYGVLIHNPKLFFDPQIGRLLDQLSDLKEKGLITKIGVSVYDSKEVDFILANFNVDLVQVPFNIIDGRLLVDNTLEKLKKRNIEIHARSVYLQGLLLMNIKEQIQLFGNWETIWKGLSTFCIENKITPLQVCLQYVLQNPLIDRVILGIDNYVQLEETIKSAVGNVIDIPKELVSLDENLCNPLNWEMYAHLRFS
ncbi:aldo/keto reductase [Aquirufa salirivi]|uniref:Aldo/keto reductase n=1 Tax=Aquirufa salirivi TaxID=3104729 RepID=A0ABW8RWE3_9BACT